MALFEKDLKKINNIVERAVKDLAKTAVDLVVKNSPIWSGDYVSSITVERADNAQSYPRGESPVISGEIDALSQESMRSSARGKGHASIESSAGAKIIHIGNSALHAHIVEMKHGVYIGSGGVLAEMADAIVKQAEAKVK
jgi:hypothetical protein